METDDARYERPCRVVLAIAAGVHWVSAALLLQIDTVQAESLDVYASRLGALAAAIAAALL